MNNQTISKENLKSKYNLYFALAYFIEIKKAKFINVSTSDSNEILHIIVHHDDLYFDSMSHYQNLRDSVDSSVAINKDNLLFESITYDQIVKYILNTQHMFDNELFMRIRKYVRNNYHLPTKK